ncbi:aryl-alcohol dehydrogenase-like predicted oxidoreductase [Winogradskyella eximia]|uniref:Aryl-alcohol dehydrogenase-like predicted oxidoreductase n=1 Tax=Winogradskyella eximia TaxID=262006 RepID=A0A3D9H2C1_9FLAO|nr:aldo/keto reductase [Winogradskyella eximia]RED43625.1 aryl-alcohol dehydrogenase-like predicted oxidoreductase [Winogradskyella eximia]
MINSKHIGLGTAAIGRPLYINIKQDANTEPFSLPIFKENGLEVLEDAYNKGIRYFDTSPGYGIAEQLLLQWLKTKNDPSIQVSTKWGYTYVANFDPNATQHEVKEHSLNKLNEQWEFSKELLPYLKVYQIHSATFDTGVLENVEVLKRLHELKQEHNIIIGLTTTGANQTEVLEKGLSIQVENESLFQSFQCTYNILDQSVFKYAEALKSLKGPFIIKEALANGRLIPNEDYPQYRKLYDLINRLAKQYNVGADAIALRYCIAVFPEALVLSGANNAEHLSANLKADQFSLTNSEIEQLSAFKISNSSYWEERKALTWN